MSTCGLSSSLVLSPLADPVCLHRMFCGSLLARDSVTEVVKRVRSTSPAETYMLEEERWEASVAAPALALRELMQKLS